VASERVRRSTVVRQGSVRPCRRAPAAGSRRAYAGGEATRSQRGRASQAPSAASPGTRAHAPRGGRQSAARQLELGGVAGRELPQPAHPSPGPFFWSIATQHVARAAARIPLRDVEAAAAGAGAFALWALALSLLVA